MAQEAGAVEAIGVIGLGRMGAGIADDASLLRNRFLTATARNDGELDWAAMTMGAVRDAARPKAGPAK